MGLACVGCGRVSLRSTQRRPGMTHFSRDERSADASAPGIVGAPIDDAGLGANV